MKKFYVLGAALLLSASLFAMGDMKKGTDKKSCGEKVKSCCCAPADTNKSCNCCCCGSTATTTTDSEIKK